MRAGASEGGSSRSRGSGSGGDGEQMRCSENWETAGSQAVAATATVGQRDSDADCGNEIVGEKEADKGGDERCAESQQAEQRLRAGAKLRRILVGGSASSEEGGNCQGSEVESVQGVGAQRVEGKEGGQAKIFYCKWNWELGGKGKWEKKREFEGELLVVGGYARVCTLGGRVVDTRKLTEAELVNMEYLEKGDEIEIGRVKVVLREGWRAEESESDYGW